MVGTVEDPENGAAVAATVFSAVIVYVVCHPPKQQHISALSLSTNTQTNSDVGFYSVHSCSLSAAGSRRTCTSAIIEEGRFPYHNETERNREQYIRVRDRAWEGDREAFGVMRYVMDHSRAEWC